MRRTNALLRSQFAGVAWLAGVVLLALLSMVCSASFAAADKWEPIGVENVSLKKLKGNAYEVTATGSVSTPGWKVRLSPEKGDGKSEEYKLTAEGIRPSGMVAQVISSWKATAKVKLKGDAKRVVVKGKNGSVSADVPS